MKEQTSIRLIRLASSRPAKYLLQKTSAMIGRNPQKNFPRLINLGIRMSPKPYHDAMYKVRDAFLQKPAVSEYIRRIFSEVHPRLQKGMLFNYFVNFGLMGNMIADQWMATRGIQIPYFLLVDPTSRCNLKCIGCWAGEYPKTDTISIERMDRLCQEAKALGIYWFVMSGGEPFLYPQLFDLAAKHQDMCLMLYTNGTLINEKVADRMFRVANMSPAFSLEGFEGSTDGRRGKGVFQKVIHAMDLLHERGIPFGFSLTITRQNCYEIMSDRFIDFLISKGCLYGWTFHYVPVGRDPDLEMMVTPEQRAWLAQQVPRLRSTKPIQFADFWNDGELVGGCIAGGRRYCHINAKGDVEPCAFVHFATDNIHIRSLLEVLQGPLFKAYQKRQPFSENLYRACPIIDVPQALRDIVAESGAHGTCDGAEDVFTPEVAGGLDDLALRWKETSDPLWQARHPSFQPEPIPEPVDRAEELAEVAV